VGAGYCQRHSAIDVRRHSYSIDTAMKMGMNWWVGRLVKLMRFTEQGWRCGTGGG
jgi:hypothetical protein